MLFEVCPPCHPSTIPEIPSRDSDTVSNKRGPRLFSLPTHGRVMALENLGAVNPPAARLQSWRKANHPLKFFSLPRYGPSPIGSWVIGAFRAPLSLDHEPYQLKKDPRQGPQTLGTSASFLLFHFFPFHLLYAGLQGLPHPQMSAFIQ